MERQGEGLPKKGVVAQSMLLPVPAAAASERVAAFERADLLHF